ncbi:hypothetical protein Bca101_019416 [Brassica carinata]
MNRPRKKKESSLLHELRELELLGDGEFVDIPELENEDLLEENSMSIIVRCLNPTVHKVGGLVKALPPIWGMEDSVKGRGVGENRVQFFFQNERDLHFVLSKGPWFVNGWIVSLDKWSPNPGPDFLCKIPFWIRIRGLPVHLLKKQAVESLVGPLGFVEKVELHAKNSASVEYVRALVWINTEEPLQFRRIARFRSGEIVPTELEYEKLIKVCFNCKRLTHDQLYCPMQEGLTVDYRSAPGNEKQPTRSEAMEGPNRQRKEESRQRSGAGRGARRGRSSIPEQAPRRTASQSRSRDSGRKDKRVVEDSVQVWRPKKVTTVSPKEVGRSRSTEESSAPLKHRSISQTQPGTGASSGASQDSPSVFNRLGGQNEISPLSRHLSGKQREADDSTPSVFERLSGLESSAPLERNLKAVEPSGNKRRRLSRSDERSSKKAKVVAAQEEATPTVFERLGSGGKGDSRQLRPPQNLRVSDLLINDGREWNTHLLARLFPEAELREMVKIRTCGKGSRDVYIWDYNKTGHYSVKSGYWVITNILNPEKTREEDQPSLDRLYQLAWKTHTSPKIHHFLWRCINNAVPVASNLARRRISKDTGCFRCGNDTETINHVLFQCPFARLVWAHSSIPAPPGGIMNQSFYSNFFHALNVQNEYPNDELQVDIVPWLLWRLWKNRNEMLFKGKEYEAESLVRKAEEDAEEWKARKTLEKIEAERHVVQKPTTTIQSTPWRPPPQHWLKCNSDGAWSKERDITGLGWLCRDENGSVVWAGARSVAKAGSPILAEAEALRWGAETMANFGYKNIIFESDSVTLVNMINGTEATWPNLLPTIEVIRFYLLQIGRFEVRYYPRGGNKAADRIAKESITFVSSTPKLYSVVPLWLKYQVGSDNFVYHNFVGE